MFPPLSADPTFSLGSSPEAPRSPRHLLRTLLGALAAIAVVAGCARGPEYQVTVRAGAYDRSGTIASFDPPAPVRTGSWHLEGPGGTTVPLQIGADERARFPVRNLAAGGSATYRLREGEVSGPGGASVERGEAELRMTADRAPVARYRIEPELPRPELDTLYRRAGYLHPVRTPSGGTVTGDYPPDHAHHHGVWAAWTNTQYRERTPDFWNTPEGTGTVRVEAVDSTWSGPVEGGFRARHRYVDRAGEPPITVLRETWTTRLYVVDGSYRLLEVRIRQENVTDEPLVLPEYHYGGFAVRGHLAWDDTSRVEFLTSAGRDRSNGNETRARWVHVGGTVEGDSVGLAVLSHPDNFRAPQPVRIHPTMPYFCFAPSQAGEWRIEPGETYRARYRIVTYDGAPDPALLDRLWSAWARPPEVTVET